MTHQTTNALAGPRVRTIQPLLREVYGRLLRRLRQRQGRTLAEVAAEAGVSMAYLSEIERGLKEPSSEILAAVCGALDSTVVQLVGAAHQDLRELAEEAAQEARVLDLASRRGLHARRVENGSVGVATPQLVAA
jgi:transcriptional regulator with XRE-family HTH domain